MKIHSAQLKYPDLHSHYKRIWMEYEWINIFKSKILKKNKRIGKAKLSQNTFVL